jgi:hypothetical protein
VHRTLENEKQIETTLAPEGRDQGSSGTFQ